jgi:RNA polymerase subunit RPABC4/transcription elongation factor Spt4
MEFFNKLGKKASEAYDATAKKTGELAKEAKLRMKMNENKSDINDLYKEIGKKVYEKHVREENIDIRAELEEECTKIDVLSAEIETCIKSILELKNKKQCVKCQAELERDAVFCSKCGEKQPEEEVLNAEVVTEDLENSEVKPENEKEAEIVEEKVTGEDDTE